MRNFIIPPLLLLSALMATTAEAAYLPEEDMRAPVTSFSLANDAGAADHNPFRETVHLSPEIYVTNPSDNNEHRPLTQAKHQSLYALMSEPIVFLDSNTSIDARISNSQLSQSFLSTGDIIFGKILNPKLKVGMTLSIVHLGKKVYDEHGKESITEGFEVGLARIRYIRNGTAEMSIISAKEEIFKDDILMLHKISQSYYTDGPIYPHESLSGEVLHTRNTAIPAVNLDTIALNKGSAEGMKNNYLVKIYSEDNFLRNNVGERGITFRKISHPLSHHPSTIAMIFKTYPHFSYALIMKTKSATYSGDHFEVITASERQHQLAR